MFFGLEKAKPGNPDCGSSCTLLNELYTAPPTLLVHLYRDCPCNDLIDRANESVPCTPVGLNQDFIQRVHSEVFKKFTVYMYVLGVYFIRATVCSKNLYVVYAFSARNFLAQRVYDCCSTPDAKLRTCQSCHALKIFCQFCK